MTILHFQCSITDTFHICVLTRMHTGPYHWTQIPSSWQALGYTAPLPCGSAYPLLEHN